MQGTHAFQYGDGIPLALVALQKVRGSQSSQAGAHNGDRFRRPTPCGSHVDEALRVWCGRNLARGGDDT